MLNLKTQINTSGLSCLWWYDVKSLHWLIGFVYTTGSDGATILLVCCRMLHHIERGIFSTPATNGRNSTLSFRQVVIA